jgi:N-acetylglucosaminyldiphosphoundecaprenol N-acetyl-beta-D-mannosaminyltransferase
VSARFTCCGVGIDAITLDEATTRVLDLGAGRRGSTVHLANAWSLACAVRDPAQRAALDAGDLVLPDGMPLVWVARRLGLDLPDRVYGPDLFDRVVDLGRERQIRHHLYGGTAEVVATVAERLRSRHPGAEVVAADAPPFRALDAAGVEDAAARIRAVGADIVWLALGTPHQNQLAHRLSGRVPGALVGVGAAFDFLAGAKPQAPARLQHLGLEWAFRLATEPRRLARRYVVGNTIFLRELARQRPRLEPDQPASSA